MGLIKWVVGLAVFSALTGGAFMASAQGWGLPGLLEEPVSIRQQSAARRSGGGPMFLYFGTGRSHYGGGFRGGK